jgi:hypothetical protein
MTVPKEYNVVGGLVGLGPDILLEALTETLFEKDVQNLIGVCKKTLKLKDHPRFFKTVENCGLQSD